MGLFGIFQDFGWQEALVVLFVALLLFGAKRLPEIGKGLGKGIREFKDATKGLKDDVKSGLDDDAKQVSPPTQPTTPPSSERKPE